MTRTPTIAAVIIARNEASNLERCLNSLAWCNERVVIDDHSTDDTAAVAQHCGARVVVHSFEGFAKQRNWAILEAGIEQDWLLLLDADEASTESFAKAVQVAIAEADVETVAFRTCRKTMFWGKWLKRSDGFPVWIARLVKRGRPIFQAAGHGEVPVPEVDGRMGTIHEPFLHYPFSKGLGDWVSRHNSYSSREAEAELAGAHRLLVSDLFSKDRAIRRRSLRDLGRRLPARPFFRFLYQYGMKLGLLDGRPGFVFCVLMSFYEWLIVVKRRELELRRDGAQL